MAFSPKSIQVLAPPNLVTLGHFEIICSRNLSQRYLKQVFYLIENYLFTVISVVAQYFFLTSTF